MVFQVKPTWHCLDCKASGNPNELAGDQCPKCGSKNMNIPPIKKGGPEEESLERFKKY